MGTEVNSRDIYTFNCGYDIPHPSDRNYPRLHDRRECRLIDETAPGHVVDSKVQPQMNLYEAPDMAGIVDTTPSADAYADGDGYMG
ncbi:hypothetical protein E3N88_04957 [Mikania micrantha]|uniref:Uncharacterized protein n=1 Tax=Mikania micrantha TaxID=192012 RepID=A0A5N6PVX0_9ASTR|nr:hypothetical protein E3N88_04957 [Mikania micrantha]